VKTRKVFIFSSATAAEASSSNCCKEKDNVEDFLNS
jgi:hypothetical protein